MNLETALRLIQPLTEGSDVVDGWPLKAIEIHQDRLDHRKDQIHLVFSSQLTLTISYRTPQKAALKTKHFSLGIRNSEPVLSATGREIVSVVSAHLKSNDIVPPQHWVEELVHADTAASREVDLWLIPGHIGNPLDLSIRSLRVLQTIDLIFVEVGSEDSVTRIYTQFNLGKTPEIIVIPDALEPLVKHLQAGRDAQQSMALFGAAEGVPGLCDPGWRVMKASHQIGPPLSVQSLSGGSALTTALMYTAQNSSQFVFYDLFRNDDGSSPLMRELYRLKPWTTPLTMICFAKGADLLTDWRALLRATCGLEGQMTLMANLSLPNERVDILDLSQLPRTPEDFLSPTDKVVVRIDFGHQRMGFHWCIRMLRRVFI
jgi:16S rRNA C1402 (ribose-2'-O) methylase RsmI